MGNRQDALRVASGHERCARWRADRGRVEAAEPPTFPGHAVEFRRAVPGRSKGSDVRVAEVVDVHDDEVRAGWECRCGGGSRSFRWCGSGRGFCCDPSERHEEAVGFRDGLREVGFLIEEAVSGLRVDMHIAADGGRFHVGFKGAHDGHRQEGVAPAREDGRGWSLGGDVVSG